MAAAPRPELVRALAALTEDALFAIAAAGGDDEDVIRGLAKRRSDHYAAVLRGERSPGVAPWRTWMTALCVAIAPICPPRWMPMSDVVRRGLSLEGGARGVRALFTSKPSDKEVERVRRLGTLAKRCLTAVLYADGPLNPEEQELVVALVSSLGLPDREERALLEEPPFSVDKLEIYGEIDAKLGRAILRGAWFGAAADGIDPREEKVIAEIAAKLRIGMQELEAERSEARQALEIQAKVGAATVDAVRFLLSDEPEEVATLAMLAVRLLSPRMARDEPLATIRQKSLVSLAGRHQLDKSGRSTVLAFGWLTAMHADPSFARRAELARRHEKIAADLGGTAGAAAVRERMERVIEAELEGALGTASGTK
jgi:tellurite resistance protein